MTNESDDLESGGGTPTPAAIAATENPVQLTQYGIFDEPVQVVLVARAAPPGLQCQLYAMVPLPEEEDDEPEEPWASSVPGASYESAIEADQDDDAEGEGGDELSAAPIPLGNI